MQTQLILDEASVASNDAGVTFQLNSACKHPANPLLMPGEPHEWDSLQVVWPATVLRDPDDGLFRCWYCGLNAIQADRVQRQPAMPWEMGYAESIDGIHWTKPPLGQFEYRGAPTNKIINDFDGWCISCAFRNPDTPDCQRRFLSIWKTKDSFNAPRMPRALASSPDGKRWRLEDPAFYREMPPRHQMQDFWQVMFDPEDPDPNFRVKAYSQYWTPRWDGRMVRQIGLHHGPDVRSLRDAESPVILSPVQGIDEELHFATVMKIDSGGGYVMLFESDRFSTKPLHGDLRVAFSSDGRSFRRIHVHSPFVGTGPRGMWDENMLVTTSYGMQEVGDEIWIYYFGCPNLFRNWPGGYDVAGVKGSLVSPTYLGLAILPRDRFAYAQGPGSITFRPQSIGHDGVWLNADGDVRIAAVDGAGKVVEGLLGEEQFKGVYRKVHWRTPPAMERVQLRVTLPDGGRLYSIRS